MGAGLLERALWFEGEQTSNVNTHQGSDIRISGSNSISWHVLDTTHVPDTAGVFTIPSCLLLIVPSGGEHWHEGMALNNSGNQGRESWAKGI